MVASIRRIDTRTSFTAKFALRSKASSFVAGWTITQLDPFGFKKKRMTFGAEQRRVRASASAGPSPRVASPPKYETARQVAETHFRFARIGQKRAPIGWAFAPHL